MGESELNVVEVQRLMREARRLVIDMRDHADELERTLAAVVDELPEEPALDADDEEADAAEEAAPAPTPEAAEVKLEQAAESS